MLYYLFAISIKLNQDFKGFGIDNDDDDGCCNFKSFTFQVQGQSRLNKKIL